VLSLSSSNKPHFQSHHEQLMICVAVCSWIRMTIRQAFFTSLRNCDVVYLIPGVAIRRGPSIRLPLMLFEHSIGQSQLMLQA